MIFDRWIMVYGLALITIGWLVLWVVNNAIAQALVGEDHLIESAQFLFLFIAAVLFAITAITNKGFAWFFWLSAAGSFFLAMEEISWGQRLFKLETPEALNAINTQGEITLHNLAAIQPYRHWYLGIVATIGWGSSWLPLGVSQPLSPQRRLWFAFLLVVGSCLVVEYANQLFGHIPVEKAREIRFFAGRFSEIGELAFAMIVFSYSLNQLGERLYPERS